MNEALSPSAFEPSHHRIGVVFWVLVGMSAVLTMLLTYDGIISYRTLLPEFLFTLVPQWLAGRVIDDVPRTVELALILALPGAAIGSCLATGLIAGRRAVSRREAARGSLYRRATVLAACCLIMNAFWVFRLWRAYFAAF